MVRDSLRTTLSNLIDYAGLFPPAELDMKTAVRNFVSYRGGENAWALGRFVVPATRLDEMRQAAGGQAFETTALIGPNIQAEIDAAHAFGVDAVEIKAGTPAQIRNAAERIPPGMTCYFEIPLGQDPRKNLEVIAEVGARAKVRTGGLTGDAFPGSRDLARFLGACVEANVAFKATSGLHHPLRGEYSITNKPGGETALMHGFLNVFMAAAFLRAGMESTLVVRLLEDQGASPFRFDDDSVGWREESLDNDQLADARKNVGIAFGSCSFEGPIADLKKLGVL
jgi:hypothetical protein